MKSLQPEERRVLVFPEEAVLATWLYYFVPGIHEVRLDLTDRLVAYMHETLAQDPDAAFVLNRFHVSHAVWRAELKADAALESRHQRLVESMRSLPLRIFQTLLPEATADARASHLERRDRAWEAFLAQRVAFHGEASAGQSYLSQQDAMSAVLAARRLAVSAGSRAVGRRRGRRGVVDVWPALIRGSMPEAKSPWAS